MAKSKVQTKHRQEIYDYLKSLGLELDEGQRVKLSEMLKSYVATKTEGLNQQLQLLSRTEAEKAEARRERNRRRNIKRNERKENHG